MRRLLIIIQLLCATTFMMAQECDLPICVAFSTESEQLPQAAERAIANKLKQILTQNGVSGVLEFEQFALVPKFEFLDKHIVAGPPVKHVYNLSVTFEIRDTQEGTVFATYNTDLNAVGENETKAYMAAVRQIAPQSQQIKDFISRGRTKITAYYNKNYQRIMQKAQLLSKMNKNEEALYHLMSIPECCDGYATAMEEALTIFQVHIDREGEKLLTKARAIWAAGNNDKAAADAAYLLTQIDPSSKAYKQASALLGEIKEKSSKNAPWNFKMQVYKDAVSLQEQRIEAARAVGVAFGKGQQQQTTNLMFVR